MSWFVLVESNTTGSGRLFCARAREFGFRPVVLTRDPARYPYLATDNVDSQRVDTADPAAVLAACQRLGGEVAGVTSSSEYFIGTAARVARSLRLPHPDPVAIEACRDKPTQRSRLRAAGVPGPRSIPVRQPAAAAATARWLGYPVVVKPAAGSGSIATRRCDDDASVEAAAATALAAGLGRRVLVEEYLAGPEYSVETFDDRVVGVTAKLLGPEPYFVEIGHDFPAAGPTAALAETALAALRALGLGWGPAHVELRATAAGPRVVEVNPRLAGGMIPRAVQAATGIDLIAATVARVAGGEPAIEPVHQRASAIRFLVAEIAGRLVEVRGLAEARQVPGVLEVALTREPPREITLRHSFEDRLGYVIATGPDPAAAGQAATAGLLALKARIVPGGAP
ncbi:MAG TPA: ATP-grasp domain-containing protein [Natronosporangium sp.]